MDIHDASRNKTSTLESVRQMWHRGPSELSINSKLNTSAQNPHRLLIVIKIYKIYFQVIFFLLLKKLDCLTPGFSRE